MNVSTSTTISLGGGKPAEARSSWRCQGCGVNYSPDVQACHCSATPAQVVYPQTAPMPVTIGCTCGPWNSITPPPPCPVHGQASTVTVTCSGVNSTPRSLAAELSRLVRTSAGQATRTHL